jgi:hypothetical protein
MGARSLIFNFPTVNFSTVVDVQKAIKLQIWAWQLIKRKFNFKISMFNLNEKDQRVV